MWGGSNISDMPDTEPKRASATNRESAVAGPTVSSILSGVKNKATEHANRASLVGNADERGFNHAQRVASKILMHPWFQLLMTAIIVSHMGLTVQQTDQHALNQKSAWWQDACEKFFMMMYLVDIFLRMFTLRWLFFREKMNIFDLFIVTVDTVVTLIDTISSGTFDVGPISLLRALRALRIVRVIRNFATFRDLYLMLKGMAGAMRAIFFAFLLIVVVLTMFSIAAVEMINPLNKELAAKGAYPGCDWCELAFSNVFKANLTFFSSILAGDSWGKLAIPLIEANNSTALIIISAFVILELGLLNVIVAVVVDRQAQAREEDKELQHTLKQEQARASYKELITLFQSMDDDGSGSLSLEELREAYGKFQEFGNILRSVDVSVEDLATVFSSMDRDHGGTVDYEEFVDELHRMRTMEIRTLVYLTRQHVVEIKDGINALSEHILGRSADGTCVATGSESHSSSHNITVNSSIQRSRASGSCDASVGFRPFPKVEKNLAFDEHLRLTRLEHKFVTLETKVAETVQLTEHLESYRDSKHSNGTLGTLGGFGTPRSLQSSRDASARSPRGEVVTDSQPLPFGKSYAENSFADEVVPSVSASCLAAPGQDLHSAGSQVTYDTNPLPSKKDHDFSLDGLPLQATVAVSLDRDV